MVHIIGKRQCGKTTKLIHLCSAEPDSVLIVRTRDIAQKLMKQYPNMKDRIISAGSLASLRGRYYSGMYVDDMEFLTKHQMTELEIAQTVIPLEGYSFCIGEN